MIELKLIPDGTAKIPAEAQDESSLANYLQSASNIPDDADAPISSWRDVQRIIPGSGTHVALRVPGEPADYPGNSLDAIAKSITENVSGLKPHPNGWEYVPER
jgi:hypothetical protein